MTSPLRRALDGLYARLPVVRELQTLRQTTARALDLQLQDASRAKRDSHPNPLNRRAAKCFSQTDEDGITLEILRRAGALHRGTFAEFGVGDGLENNTLILRSLGWRGYWVGGQSLAFTPAPEDPTFAYLRAWITADNIVELADRGRRHVGGREADVVSLDLDGNDLYLVARLLEHGLRPKVFVVEYNAKFPPPVRWTIAYDPAHRFRSDDYFGASLCSFVDLFERFGFRLVCCNGHSGSNAFFVRDDLTPAFEDVPADVNVLYEPPRYYTYQRYGHRPSVRTVARLFEPAAGAASRQVPDGASAR